MTDERLAFVSVVYEPEVPLLHLQARSFERFVPRSLVGSVIVVDNTARGLPHDEREHVVAQFGSHADAVRVLRPDAIATLPRTTGWYAQQVLKLEVAHLLQEHLYVVLDAKNHFVAPVCRETFVGPRGLPRANTYGYEDHPLLPALARTLRYLGLDVEAHAADFTATVTPFVLDREVVERLTEDLAQRGGRPFADLMVAERLTEFFLYTGWQIARGSSIAAAFDVPLGPVATLWPGPASVDAAAAAAALVAEVRDRSAITAAVHLRAFEHLDGPATDVLAEMWSERGLIGDRSEAARLRDDVVRLHHSTPLLRRAQQLATRILTRARR